MQLVPQARSVQVCERFVAAVLVQRTHGLGAVDPQRRHANVVAQELRVAMDERGWHGNERARGCGRGL